MGQRRDWADWGVWGFNLLLVMVGGLQVWLLWGTLRAIRRQANLIDRQAGIMEKQTGVLERSVAAAEANAEAAKRNVEVVISKERARLSIELDKLTLPDEGEGFWLFSVKHRVRLYLTDAVVKESQGEAIVSDSVEPPHPDPLAWALHTAKVITPTDPPKYSYLPVFRKGGGADIKQDDIEGIRKGTLHVHFFGFVNYQDVFGGDHWTRFRYIWQFSDLPEIVGKEGERFGSWSTCGPPEDNSET